LSRQKVSMLFTLRLLLPIVIKLYPTLLYTGQFHFFKTDRKLIQMR
jgi:hypothetical protein